MFYRIALVVAYVYFSISQLGFGLITVPSWVLGISAGFIALCIAIDNGVFATRKIK